MSSDELRDFLIEASLREDLRIMLYKVSVAILRHDYRCTISDSGITIYINYEPCFYGWDDIDKLYTVGNEEIMFVKGPEQWLFSIWKRQTLSDLL